MRLPRRCRLRDAIRCETRVRDRAEIYAEIAPRSRRGPREEVSPPDIIISHRDLDNYTQVDAADPREEIQRGDQRVATGAVPRVFGDILLPAALPTGKLHGHQEGDYSHSYYCYDDDDDDDDDDADDTCFCVVHEYE